MLSIELPHCHIENQIFHKAIRQALEKESSPIAGRLFKLRFVASGSDRFGLLGPVRLYDIGPKKRATLSLIVRNACLHAFRQQALASLAFCISEVRHHSHLAS